MQQGGCAAAHGEARGGGAGRRGPVFAVHHLPMLAWLRLPGTHHHESVRRKPAEGDWNFAHLCPSQ